MVRIRYSDWYIIKSTQIYTCMLNELEEIIYLWNGMKFY